MFTKKLVSSVLALTMVSAAGVAFAADTSKADKAATAKIMKECKKEFGKDKAKTEECVKEKTNATAPAVAK